MKLSALANLLRIDRRSIEARLWLVAIFSLVGLLAASISGCIGVSYLNGALNEITDRGTPALIDIGKVRTLHLKSLLLTREISAWHGERYELSGNRQDALSEIASIAASVVQRRKEVDAQIVQALAAYQELPKLDTEEQQWKVVQQRLQDFNDSYGEALPIIAKMAAANQWEQVMDLQKQFQNLDDRIGAVWDRADAEMETLNKLVIEDAHDVQQSASAARRNAMVVIVLVAVIVTILMGGIFRAMVFSVTGALHKLRDAIVAVAESKDFTQGLTIEGKDEVAETAQAFNSLLGAMRGLLNVVRDNSSKIADAADKTLEAAKQVAQVSSRQSESAVSMAGSIDRMTASVVQISASASEAADSAGSAASAAQAGGTVIARTTEQVSLIHRTVTEAESDIAELGTHSEKISNIVQVIKDIADQTNLLALNAAIEAARAGDMGRGFAVVADEVRKLAERTTASTQDIVVMVDEVQSLTGKVVDKMNVICGSVDQGRISALDAADTILVIKENSSQVTESVSRISSSLRDHSSSSMLISQQVQQVVEMSEGNKKSAVHSERISEELQHLSLSLRNAVSVFQV